MSIKCVACGNKFYESLIRDCPVKPGNPVCLYCCRKCKRSYKGMAGTWGCRAFEERKAREEAEAKEKVKK